MTDYKAIIETLERSLLAIDRIQVEKILSEAVKEQAPNALIEVMGPVLENIGTLWVAHLFHRSI